MAKAATPKKGAKTARTKTAAKTKKPRARKAK